MEGDGLSTIKQVAIEANVSAGTVSKVLNNVSTVSAKNRESVLAAMKKLDYRPNNAARMLKTNRSLSIGLILPDIINPFYPELAKGAQNFAIEHGYMVLMSNNDRSPHKERAYIEMMMSRGVDGIILVKPYLTIEELVELSGKIPLTLVDMDVDDRLAACDVVNVDDYVGAQTAMRLILDQGHTRVGFVRGSMEGRSDRERFKAYQDVLAKEGIPFEESLVGSGVYTWDSGVKQATALLTRPQRVTALFASNDILAIGALRAAYTLGLSVPNDLSIVGYDNINTASIMIPSLTTIHRPKYEMGVAATKTLITRIQNQKEGVMKGRVITLHTAPCIRQTLERCNNEHKK